MSCGDWPQVDDYGGCASWASSECLCYALQAPFMDKISGLAIIKILHGGTHITLLIKLKFTCNVAIIDMVNNGTETMIFRPEEMLEKVDLRSIRVL